MEIYQLQCFSVLENSFHLANSTDPDEMLPDAAFHLGLHYLVPVYQYPG